LTERAGQCSVWRCNGREFAWCNMAANTQTEYANQRNIVADTNPGNQKNCIYDG
ncbi:hypothetical protein QBC36DRAFT_200237, partial [Triangularia setosa]